MIEMISGVYGGKDGIKKPGDGAFCLSPAEEARLVRRGVARYTNEIVVEPVAPDADSNTDSEELMEDIGPIGFDDMPPAEAEEPVDLESLTAKELRELGAEYGLTFKGNASKSYMIEAITAAQAELEEDDSDCGPGPDFDPTEAVVL